MLLSLVWAQDADEHVCTDMPHCYSATRKRQRNVIMRGATPGHGLQELPLGAVARRLHDVVRHLLPLRPAAALQTGNLQVVYSHVCENLSWCAVLGMLIRVSFIWC